MKFTWLKSTAIFVTSMWLTHAAFAQNTNAGSVVQGIMMKAEDFPRAAETAPVESMPKQVHTQKHKPAHKRAHKHGKKAKRHAQASVQPCAPVKPVEPASCTKPQ